MWVSQDFGYSVATRQNSMLLWGGGEGWEELGDFSQNSFLSSTFWNFTFVVKPILASVQDFIILAFISYSFR